MDIKTFLGSKNWGMFLVRVVVGLVFIVHGWDKIGNIEGVIGFFGSLGLPSIFAYLVGWTEFLGGLAVLLGLFYKYAAYLLAIVMVGAIYLVKFKMGFSGGYEFDLLLLVSALAIAWTKDMPYKVL
jgi:uncharacterized membrane protein YphA (DoxX/SURF4 family)